MVVRFYISSRTSLTPRKSKHDEGNDAKTEDQALIIHLDHGNYKSGQTQPIRLYNTENDLAKFSKVKATHGFYPLPTCEHRRFQSFNKSDKPMVINWKVITFCILLSNCLH